jgi:hypothetical protein
MLLPVEQMFEGLDNPPLTKSQKIELRRAERQKQELQNAVRGVQATNMKAKILGKAKNEAEVNKM